MKEHAGVSAEAQEALAAYVGRVGAGEGIDFETFCDEHAGFADELRRLRGLADALVGKNVGGSLSARIREHYGPEVDPNISLEGTGDGDPDDASETDQLLSRQEAPLI